MNDTLVKQNKITRICSSAAVCLLALVFILLSVASVLQTSRIDPANPAAELINFDNDYIPVNLALILLTALAFIALLRKRISLQKVDTRFILFIMLIVATVISLSWINLTKSVANGDESILLTTAKDASKGVYTNFYQSYDFYGNNSYFMFYPEKLGFVLFAEVLYRIFGIGSNELLFQIPNVIALDLIYVGVVMIAKHVFNNKTVTNMTAIAFIVCLQPMFMVTFTQSYFYSLALSVWGVYFAVRYMKENKLLHAGLCALLIALGCVLRESGLLFMIAVGVALIVHTVDQKRLIALAVAAVTVLCSIGLPWLVTLSYASRSGTQLNTRITRTMYTYIGISDSSMAPGWYNGMGVYTLRDAGMDTAAGNEAARQGIDNRVSQLSADHKLVEFYQKKLFSQFNEPSFQSVWISQVKSHDLPEGEALSDIATSVYTGGLSTLLDVWFNYYQMILYIGFTVGLIFLVIRKRTGAAALILPLTILGGVICRMLFEAKSQYILPYFIILIPYAMFGLLEITRVLTKKTDWMFKANQAEETDE